ncbi:ATP-binding protein [Bacteroides sp. 224]|uniref:ATP-binding protein n=1 Tax=Bacteroides sp. 224 TaxID=2302936 RepID=UPI0013D450E1|nr:ATP-binding protein [Bacteroides sp. 224]MDH8702495.1 AAA+ ATPase superfamily predicted ATPase [Dysgonomonadaceae bacterium PH5-43]NDV64919.1 ATP-binding protein [Bacteroides sp. 224]
MKFYNRTAELDILARTLEQSKRSSCFTVMVGRRRIGKTSLLLESVKGQKYLYLFVSRKSEPLLCEQFQKDAADVLGLQIFGSITRFKDLFEQLLIFATKEHYTLIIDEFQEFDNVNSSIFSDVQNLWDQYKDKTKINFIASGSIYSMMMKIFENRKEPLFGRLTSKITLQPFAVSVIKEILNDYNPKYTSEDLLCLYMLTGGVPKYIDLLMEGGAVTKNKILDVVTRPDSPFIGEGKELLISEFGKEYGTYFSILQLIASGKTTQSEIDSIIGKNTGAYLVNLEKEYSLITKNKPMFSKPESRKARWSLNDNYLRFWFRFIYPNQSLIEMGKYDLLREFIDKNYEQYSGFTLEKYFRAKMAEEERITAIGSYWDSKGENEIDLIALNDLDKTAIVAEVKRNPKKIDMTLLQGKADSIKKELAKYKIELRGLSMNDM